MPLGFRPREVLGLVRDVQGVSASAAPIVVLGFLGEELARGLQAGSADAGAVRVGGNPDAAAVLVVVVAGLPGPAEEQTLRAATRRGTPFVVVQTDSRARVAVPYALAADVVECSPGSGFPIPEIAAALARRLGHDSVALAARLPALQAPVAERLIAVAARRAAFVGLSPWSKRAHFPLMAMIQARLVLDLAAAHGQAIDGDRAPDLAAVAATGLGLRATVRRLPARLPLVGAATGYLGTRAIGEAALRKYAVGMPPS
jgi:uncharacterized protein (DUF697 family)